MLVTPVEDLEDLYRAIRMDRGEFALGKDGHIRFSASAFNDRDRTPSVDRSSIRTEPRDARLTETDGVTAVNTAAVRAVRTIRIDPAKKTDERVYQVDAIHRPLPDDEDPTENSAHCQIECCPSIASDTHFKKLKEALALLANERGFVVLPSNHPPGQFP